MKAFIARYNHINWALADPGVTASTWHGKPDRPVSAPPATNALINKELAQLYSLISDRTIYHGRVKFPEPDI